MHPLRPGLSARKAAARALSLGRGGKWATGLTTPGGAKEVPAVGTSHEELPFLIAGHCVGRVTRASSGGLIPDPRRPGTLCSKNDRTPCRRHRLSDGREGRPLSGDETYPDCLQGAIEGACAEQDSRPA
jgi:hypothetical protein